MAWTEKANDSASNGTTAATILSAPMAGHTYVVRLINIFNADTVSQIVTVRLNSNGTYRTISKQVLAPDARLAIVEPIVLDATTKSIEIVLGAAKTTNDMAVMVSYADRS
jgi:hypothetical protein